MAQGEAQGEAAAALTFTASDQERLRRAVYLTGPTAVGKTAVGVELARRLGAQILALDSMTLYRGMDIGTAKPSLAERGGVPHHLIDLLGHWEDSSVSAYRAWAVRVLADLERDGVPALFVGGTPLYLKVLLRGLFPGPPGQESLREELAAEALRDGGERIWTRLRTIDPASAARLHPGDRRRIIRALEVHKLTGKPLSEWQTEHGAPVPGVRVIALERPRQELTQRIESRVDAMFDGGLVAEVEGLLASGRMFSRTAIQGVGYPEVVAYLEGRLNRGEAIARVKARTRQFAKRQATWFRGLEEVRFAEVPAGESPGTAARRLEACLQDADNWTFPGRRILV